MDTAAFVARIEVEFDAFRIPHPRLVEVGQRLAEMRGVAQASRAKWIAQGMPRKRMPQMFLPVIAPSGSGKSTSINMYLEDVVAKETLGKDQRPIVHVTLSSEATTKRLGSDILEEFGDPDPETGTAPQLLRRSYNALEIAETDVLVIDEIQHLIHADTGQRTAWSVTETLKRMLIRGACPMVLMGTPEARSVLLSNPQMKQRALEPVFLEPLDIQVAEERAMFIDHVAGIDLKMVERKLAPDLSGLVMDDLPACFFDVSKGVIGTVSKLVMAAAKHAARDGRRGVTRDDLSHATRRWAIPTGITDHDPFSAGPRDLKQLRIAA